MGKSSKQKRKNQKSKANDSQTQTSQKVADNTIKVSDIKEKVDTNGSSLNISSSKAGKNNVENLSTFNSADTLVAKTPPITVNFVEASPNTVLAKSQLNPMAKVFTQHGNAGCSETDNKRRQTVSGNVERGHGKNSEKNCNYSQTPQNQENLTGSDNSVLSGEDSPLLNTSSTVGNVKDKFHNQSHKKCSSEYRNQESVHRKHNYDESPMKSKLIHKTEYSHSKDSRDEFTKKSLGQDSNDFSRNPDNFGSTNYTAEIDDSKNIPDSSWNNLNNDKHTTKANRSYSQKLLRDPRMEREYARNNYPESFDKSSKRKITIHFDEFPDNWRGPDSSKANGRKGTGRQLSYHSTEREVSKERIDKNFDDWEKNWKRVTKFDVVKEIDGDLFQQPKDFSLAHCVAEDLRMGSGIAVDFKQQFKKVDDLMQQRPKQGGLAVLEDAKNGRFVYYLVTKRESNLKPTYYTLWKSLCKMRDHIKEHKVINLAIPRIGCGLDRLEWERVKAMLEILFKDVEEFQITVCNFQQLEDTPTPGKYYPCKLVSSVEHVSKIEQGTAIFYFTTEQGDKDDTIRALTQKFDNFLPSFNDKRSKSVGDFIFYEEKVKNYLFCGCVVRKTTKDLFDFKAFSKCLYQFMKTNRNYGNNAFFYVAFQKLDWKEYRDDLINEKVITLFINMLRNVEVYYCTGYLETESTK